MIGSASLTLIDAGGNAPAAPGTVNAGTGKTEGETFADLEGAGRTARDTIDQGIGALISLLEHAVGRGGRDSLKEHRVDRRGGPSRRCVLRRDRDRPVVAERHVVLRDIRAGRECGDAKQSSEERAEPVSG